MQKKTAKTKTKTPFDIKSLKNHTRQKFLKSKLIGINFHNEPDLQHLNQSYGTSIDACYFFSSKTANKTLFRILMPN